MKRATAILLLVTGLSPHILTLQPAAAHRARHVTARSICPFEENYYVWSPQKPWRVWGRVQPGHHDKRVVLQRSKSGGNWRKWKATRTRSRGRYEFRGTAPDNGSKWYVLLRVVFKAQDGHRRKVSGELYVDENRFIRVDESGRERHSYLKFLNIVRPRAPFKAILF